MGGLRLKRHAGTVNHPEDAQDKTFWISRIRVADPHLVGKGEEEEEKRGNYVFLLKSTTSAFQLQIGKYVMCNDSTNSFINTHKYKPNLHTYQILLPASCVLYNKWHQRDFALMQFYLLKLINKSSHYYTHAPTLVNIW